MAGSILERFSQILQQMTTEVFQKIQDSPFITVHSQDRNAADSGSSHDEMQTYKIFVTSYPTILF